MTAIIKNTTPEKERVAIIERVKKQKNPKSLRKHFGLLKRQLDGMEYQKQLRNEWD